jgi:hypothetical protein
VSRTSWFMYLNIGTFPNMSSIVGNLSGRNGRVIFILLGVFIFYPATDVPASATSMPSSSPVESDRSVMSSTSTLYFSLDCHDPTVSFGLPSTSGLQFEPLFLASDLYPISHCCTVGSSPSTYIGLIDYGSEVVTSSSLNIFYG